MWFIVRCILVVIAIIFPPVAVLLRRGPKWAFLFNIFLTLCFFVPGVLHALRIVLDKGDQTAAILARIG